MLVEVVLTPDLFSGDDDVLRERLRDLADILLPRRSVPIVDISQLGEHNWQSAVGNRIVAIKNRNLQSDAKALFDRFVDSVCVVRIPQQNSIPATESEWIALAKQSAKQVPLDAIVTVGSQSTEQAVMAFAEFTCDEFWARFPNPRWVERNSQAQVTALRTIAFHADWLIVRLPQLRGGSDDEIVTFNQILALVAKRGTSQPRCSIELQVCQQKDIPDERLLNGIQRELQCNGSIMDVTFKLLPQKSFIDRELLAGGWAPMPEGKRARRARWLLTMTHVAVSSKRENISQASPWSLFDRKHAHDRLSKLEAEPGVRLGDFVSRPR